MTASPTARRCIVTGSDARMEHLLHDLLKSLHDTGVSVTAHIVVLDFGLSPSMRSRLTGLCDQIVDPKPALSSTVVDAMDDRQACAFYRAYLPMLMPGYEVYFWLDADVWVQVPAVFDAYSGFTKARDIVLAAELDPAYANHKRRFDWCFYRAKAMYGQETAQRLAVYPILNTGVFAAGANSSMWSIWQDHLEGWRDRSANLLSDQISMNYLIRSGKISAYLLPATYNWVCHAATPKWFVEHDAWKRPLYPHSKIHIMHLTSTSRDFSSTTNVDGSTVNIDLTYSGALKLRELGETRELTGTE